MVDELFNERTEVWRFFSEQEKKGACRDVRSSDDHSEVQYNILYIM